MVDGLGLGLIASEGRSLPSLIGLFDSADFASATPVASYGQGTRRFALLTLAAALAGDHPIVTIDEAELGLEPYRQRLLVAAIREVTGTGGQAFITTHSPALLQAAEPKEVHLLHKGASPKMLDGGRSLRLLQDQPLAFLSRSPDSLRGPHRDGATGCPAPRVSHPGEAPDARRPRHRASRREWPARRILPRATTLLEYVPEIGLFLDNEEDHSGRRAEFGADERVVFFAWPDHTCVEDVLAHEYDLEQLEDLIDLAAELQGKDSSDLLKQVASEAELAAVENIADLFEKAGDDAGRRCVAAVMHKKGWFKKRIVGWRWAGG